MISCDVDGVILQHSPKRKYYDGWEHVGALMPSIDSEVALVEAYGKSVIAIALSTSKMTEKEIVDGVTFLKKFGIAKIVIVGASESRNQLDFIKAKMSGLLSPDIEEKMGAKAIQGKGYFPGSEEDA